MRINKLHIIKNVVTALAVTLFFSCKNNFNEIQQIGVLQNAPLSIADTINLKHTDSSRLVANLISNKMYDYSNRPFGYSEFPKGIVLIVFDKDGNESKIFADYAIMYNETDLVDLRGNVILATHQGDSLFTPHLYYDQKNKWVFTDDDYRLKGVSMDLSGRIMDSDSQFDDIQMLEPAGPIQIKN